MMVRKYSDVKAKPTGEDALHTTVRWLIAEPEGATHFAMRLFEVGPEGYTPLHRHPWEHEVFVLEGEGAVVSEDGEHEMSGGCAVFVPEDELHQFKNRGSEPLRMLCMIPR